MAVTRIKEFEIQPKTHEVVKECTKIKDIETTNVFLVDCMENSICDIQNLFITSL